MRLTYELGHGKTGEYDTINDKEMPVNNIWKAINKLGQLEDIEDELGIDLITLFKALRQDNVWVKEHNTEEQEIVYERIRLNFLNRTLDFVYPRKEIGIGRNLFDYGKTWALTKEELK